MLSKYRFYFRSTNMDDAWARSLSYVFILVMLGAFGLLLEGLAAGPYLGHLVPLGILLGLVQLFHWGIGPLVHVYRLQRYGKLEVLPPNYNVEVDADLYCIIKAGRGAPLFQMSFRDIDMVFARKVLSAIAWQHFQDKLNEKSIASHFSEFVTDMNQ